MALCEITDVYFIMAAYYIVNLEDVIWKLELVTFIIMPHVVSGL